MRTPLLFLIAITSLFTGCEDDELYTAQLAKLSFSKDTVFFDTVFTGIGSATKRFKVYNNYNKPVNIASVELAGGQRSSYSLNIDGVAANSVNNVEIKANDSIYIFVEVNINPTEDDMIEKDSIMFHLNGNFQNVKTVAFGQNVHLLNDATLATQTWTAERPYLVYSAALVDTLETLTIEAGTKIYFHQGASLFVLGSLNVNGNKQNPVIFQGDRLETFYEDKPGQWGAYTILENGATYVFGGIHFLPGSFENQIDYAIIKNANKGIQIDSAVGQEPALEISNTIISHMNMSGIYAQTSRIEGYNLVINNCATHAIALTLGGSYNFNHITIANFTPYASRNTASIALNNYYTYNGSVYVYDLIQASFTNSIIYGDGGEYGNEIVIDNAGEGAFNYLFDHCIVKTGEEFSLNDTAHFKNILNELPDGVRFVSTTEYNFELDTLSPAIDAGKSEYGELNPQDMNQNTRTIDQAPDLGAYERQ